MCKSQGRLPSGAENRDCLSWFLLAERACQYANQCHRPVGHRHPANANKKRDTIPPGFPSAVHVDYRRSQADASGRLHARHSCARRFYSEFNMSAGRDPCRHRNRPSMSYGDENGCSDQREGTRDSRRAPFRKARGERFRRCPREYESVEPETSASQFELRPVELREVDDRFPEDEIEDE